MKADESIKKPPYAPFDHHADIPQREIMNSGVV
jgi:hypothetical protein